MAYSYQETVADGTTVVVPVTFGFVSRSHVGVKVNGVAVTFGWLSASENSVVLANPPAAGAVIRVYRTTPITGMLYDYSKGAQFSSTTLDANYRQLLYIEQELVDGGFGDLSAIVAQVQADAASASASANSALASANAVARVYLGALSADPTVDGTGSPVRIGALYFNTTSQKLRVYTTLGWENATTVASLPRVSYTAVAGQVEFMYPSQVPITAVQVLVNGVYMLPYTDFTPNAASTGAVLAEACVGGEAVTIQIIKNT